MLHIPELQVPDALPCACVQLSIRDRDCDACANQRRLDMCRHIIAALSIMQIQALPLLVLGHYPVQRRAHVGPHIFVPVLVQRQGARCVLDEQVQEPRLVVLDLRQLFEDRVGD